MNRIGNHPFLALLDSGTTLNELRQIYNQLVVSGILNDDHLLGHFVGKAALSSPKSLGYACEVLDRSHNPTLFALNSMIRAHCKSPTPEKCFDFYRRILCSGNNLSPDNYTINFMVTACKKLVSREAGIQIHGTATRCGFDNDPRVQSGLISLYAELGCLDSSHKVFRAISDPVVACQTTMFIACAKCGDIAFARRLFQNMPERDAVAWNAMISVYAHYGEPREALNLFHLMQLEGFTVNEVSMVSVLSACTQLGALDQGRWVHAYIEKNKIKITVKLGTALIDFYAKCGDMNKAVDVFRGMKEKNVYTWSSMINGLAINGFGEKCLELFSRMKQEGVTANTVTFTSVLKACSAVGLVDEGQKHFDAMRNDYGIEPRLEHYGCLVDLYGRAGRLDEALSVIQGMSMKPHNATWGALLNACRMYKNTEMAKLASSKLLELEDKNGMAYALLSNIYAESNKWDNASHVRELMKSKGIRKEPGCSVMEINGEVHEFFTGDKSHPRYGEIEAAWTISQRLRLAGYRSDTSHVHFDIEVEEKEDVVCFHSEKMAIAFGMISSKEGVPIRIVNNFRVCRDSHRVCTMISEILDREIVMRDRNRFHHFKDGECSCKGFW